LRPRANLAIVTQNRVTIITGIAHARATLSAPQGRACQATTLLRFPALHSPSTARDALCWLACSAISCGVFSCSVFPDAPPSAASSGGAGGGGATSGGSGGAAAGGGGAGGVGGSTAGTAGNSGAGAGGSSAAGGSAGARCGAKPRPPGGECPALCDSCSEGRCEILCSGTKCKAGPLECPAGFACSFRCSGIRPCEGASLRCTEAYACDVTCEGN